MDDDRGIILRLLAQATLEGDGWMYGWDIMKASKLSSGRVYPALAKLVRGGLVDRRQEDVPHDAGLPARMQYHVTGAGHQARADLAPAAAADEPARAPELAPAPAPGTT